jgi:hypothetical protein
MSHTTETIIKTKDRLGIHHSEDLPPSEWGAWTDESVDALGADEAPGWWLDRLDAVDESEAD